MAKDVAAQTQKMWNAANGKVTIDGVKYNVKFDIKGEYRDVSKSIDFLPGAPKVAGEILTNKDIRKNFYRVESTSKGSETTTDVGGNSSFFFGANTGYISSEQNARTGGTTVPHEMGHGWGAGHLKYDGKTKNMMNTERQLGSGAKDRKVTQSDIDDLGLENLNFDENGKADVGSKTNMYYDKSLEKGYVMPQN